MKTQEEINHQIDVATDNPDMYPGMSYADGIKAALEWVLGYTDENPTEGY